MPHSPPLSLPRRSLRRLLQRPPLAYPLLPDDRLALRSIRLSHVPPLSLRRSPHALAAYTRSPHARRTRPSLFVSFTVRGRRLTTMLRPGLPSCRPTLHAHAAAPIHHPQCPRLDPLRQHPPHHTPRRLTALSSTPISPPSLEQGPGLSVTSSARSARDGAAPLTPVRTPP